MVLFLKQSHRQIWWGAERNKVLYINQIHLEQYKTWTKQVSQVGWRKLSPLHSPLSKLPAATAATCIFSKLETFSVSLELPLHEEHSGKPHCCRPHAEVTDLPESHHGTPRTERQCSASSLPSHINIFCNLTHKGQMKLLCFTYFKIGLFQAADHWKSNKSDPLHHLGYLTSLFL